MQLKFKPLPEDPRALLSEERVHTGGMRGICQCVLHRATAQEPASVCVTFEDEDLGAFTVERVLVPTLEEAAEIACSIVDRFVSGEMSPAIYLRSWPG